MIIKTIGLNAGKARNCLIKTVMTLCMNIIITVAKRLQYSVLAVKHIYGSCTWCVQVLRSPKEAFAAAMESWRERCEKCVCLQADYIEK